MLVSKSKRIDIEFRENMLDMLEHCAKTGDKDGIKYYSEQSNWLKKKIETYDYSYEDVIRNKQDALTKQFEQLVSPVKK